MLLDGLPQAIHKCLIEAADLRDALAWLNDGVPVPPLKAAPVSGERSLLPERYLVQAIGIASDGERWVHFSRWKWPACDADELQESEWHCTLEGYEVRGAVIRSQLQTTGARNARRYHVWHDGNDAGDMELFEYTDPSPLYEIGADEPDRRRLPMTPAQDALLRFIVML